MRGIRTLLGSNPRESAKSSPSALTSVTLSEPFLCIRPEGNIVVVDTDYENEEL